MKYAVVVVVVVVVVDCSSIVYGIKYGGVVQWQELRSWSANFHCHTLDLQLMGDHLCG